MPAFQGRKLIFCTFCIAGAVVAAFGSGRTLSDADWVVVNNGEFPGTDGVVNAVAYGKGVTYVGGKFTRAGNVAASNIAQWDGTRWSELGSGCNDVVNALVCDGLGNLFAGGMFDTVDGIRAARLAKWDGKQWTSFGTGVSGWISALALDGTGNLYVGGWFNAVDGVSARGIAKWNGSTWSALGAGLNKYVYALAADKKGNLYAGGAFDSAGTVKADLIALWNGSSWIPLGSGIWTPDESTTPYQVAALALDSSGNLYAGGSFDSVGGTNALNIAKWDGQAWSKLGTGVNSTYSTNYPVLALACDAAGNVYAGGAFKAAGGISYASHVARWNGHFWYCLGSGLDTAGCVRALALDNTGNLLLGGKFSTVAGVPAYNIGKWDGYAGSAFGSGIDGQINTLALGDSGNLYIGGNFSTIAGKQCPRVVAWNNGGWRALDTGLMGTVKSLAYCGNGVLYAGGSGFFLPYNSTSYSLLSKWDGRHWRPLGPSSDFATLYALAATDSAHLYGGGVLGYYDFCIGKFNGSSWDTLGPGVSMPGVWDVCAVYALTHDSKGNFFAGGIFDSAGHERVNNVARWDGNAWNAVGSGTNGTVYAVACDTRGNLFAGGNFIRAGGRAAINIARWNGSNWDSCGSGLNKEVQALACDDSGNLYAGGFFDTAGGIAANHIAKWDGMAWSAVGSGIKDTGYAFGVNALLVSDTTLFVGGNFTVAGKKCSPNIAMVKLNGAGNATVTKPLVAIQSKVRFRVVKSCLIFSKLAKSDRISLYSLSGRLLHESQGVSRINLSRISPQPIIVRVNREGKIIAIGKVMVQ
jgi:hypothetical protein